MSGLTTTFEGNKGVLIAVMGATGSGKTTFINRASAASLRVGTGLRSCTNDVQAAQPFELDGRMVTLVDTPGFDDTTKSDTEVLTLIAAFLASTYQQGTKLAGVIYMHRISDFRMGGISTRNFKMFREICGETTLKNLVVVTNMWGEVSPQIGEAREAELASDELFFKRALDKGAQLLRHNNTAEGARSILRHIICNHPIPLRIQRELVDRGKDISETAAGAELSRELNEQAKKYREDLRKLDQEMKEALRLKDEETKQELEIETQKLQAEMDRVRSDAQNLASSYDAEKARLEQQMKEMNEASQRQIQTLITEYEQKLQEMAQKIQEGANGVEVLELRRRILELETQIRNLRRGGGGGCIIF